MSSQSSTRSRAIKPEIQSHDIGGLKYFDRLRPLLERLHDDGCQRDTAGNRKLHDDQYCILILLCLFNQIVTSLRGIQQASELKKVQRKLGCPRASLGSLSEATDIFDAERLQEIITDLGKKLQAAVDSRLKDTKHTLTLVDFCLAADDGGFLAKIAQSVTSAFGFGSKPLIVAPETGVGLAGRTSAGASLSPSSFAT